MSLKINQYPAFSIGDGKITTIVGSGKNQGAYSSAIQSDGKILVAGYTQNSNYDFAIIRYQINGSLDTSFGGTGKIQTSIGTDDISNGLALQIDGKILLAGFSRISQLDQFTLVRYDVNGALDSSFGGGTGKVSTQVGGGSSYADAIAIQDDGKIVVAGSAEGRRDMAVVRYASNGSLDSSFGNGAGIVTTQLDFGNTIPRDLAIQPDGKIVVVGYTELNGVGDIFVVRYKTDGTLDSIFGSGTGIKITGVGPGQDYASGVALQSDGKILVAGFSEFSGVSRLSLLRYNSAGDLDASFGGGSGKVTLEVGINKDAEFDNIKLQPDGKIVLAGRVQAGSQNGYEFLVVRCNTDGTLDTSFGNGTGKVSSNISGGADLAYSLALQADGKIVVSGTSSPPQVDFSVATQQSFAVIRYNNDGTIDKTFDSLHTATIQTNLTYIENQTPIALSKTLGISDPDLNILGQYGGSSLTLTRRGGGNSGDKFSGLPPPWRVK